MGTANNTATYYYPLLFYFSSRWHRHHASGWEQLIHATHPNRIWSVGKITFLHNF